MKDRTVTKLPQNDMKQKEKDCEYKSQTKLNRT